MRTGLRDMSFFAFKLKLGHAYTARKRTYMMQDSGTVRDRMGWVGRRAEIGPFSLAGRRPAHLLELGSRALGL